RSHVGFNYDQDCKECLDFCRKGCKSDAGAICVMPALTAHRANILPECEVLELIANGSRVESVRAKHRGQEILLAASIVVLAAGSVMTPIVLLNSRSAAWPDGLANRSGQVGRNLMLHTSDIIAIDPRRWHPPHGPVRAIALNDFYVDRDT